MEAESVISSCETGGASVAAVNDNEDFSLQDSLNVEKTCDEEKARTESQRDSMDATYESLKETVPLMLLANAVSSETTIPRLDDETQTHSKRCESVAQTLVMRSPFLSHLYFLSLCSFICIAFSYFVA